MQTGNRPFAFACAWKDWPLTGFMAPRIFIGAQKAKSGESAPNDCEHDCSARKAPNPTQNGRGARWIGKPIYDMRFTIDASFHADKLNPNSEVGRDGALRRHRAVQARNCVVHDNPICTILSDR
jgi:hypothetical protein